MEDIQIKTKFCKFCGEKIPEDAVMCTHCGRQVEQLKGEQPQVVINNTNTNTNMNKNIGAVSGRPKNKWVAIILCAFLGFLGAHKFYEGKTGMGILYLFTCGLFGVGIIIDFIALLFKPNPYYI
jgi:restriction system protein